MIFPPMSHLFKLLVPSITKKTNIHNKREYVDMSIFQHGSEFSGQNCKFCLSFFCLTIPKRDLDTQKTLPNIEVCPESPGAMLEY